MKSHYSVFFSFLISSFLLGVSFYPLPSNAQISSADLYQKENDESEEMAFLDAPYKDLKKPQVDVFFQSVPPESGYYLFEEIYEFMSPVKSQKSRGTCSIFASVALVEGLMIRDRKNVMSLEQTDLSEEWVEFLSIANRQATEDGSWSHYNWSMMTEFGPLTEEQLPYVGEEWQGAEYGLAQERCGHLKAMPQRFKSCLIGHFDPALLRASIQDLNNNSSDLYNPQMAELKVLASNQKKLWFDNYFQHLSPWSYVYEVSKVSTARKLLQDKVPLVLSLDFFYGAWNHRGGSSIGLVANADHWAQGIVGHPTPDSVDRKRSKEKYAGHAITIVGYDDHRIVTVKIPVYKLIDGQQKIVEEEKTFVGVYYFKNSWGTVGFGKDFSLDGKTYPGYGMITYDYAHEYGSFYQLPLVVKNL